jgi:serine/threonine protein kinase
VAATRRTVGRYEIAQEIGSGGMATVYVARQLDLDRWVALKELRSLGTMEPSFARRFLREARLAGSLSHPNIVTVHEYFEHDRVPYIAMEYLSRGSLRPYLGRRLALAQVGGVLEGLLGGLAHAERHEVVHRDIKPENLLVTPAGGIKIADFGIARATHALEAGSLLTKVGTTVGTPNYIAPEQAMGRQLGPSTDLYSVGVAAFEMLVGRTPFGDTEEPMGILLRQINEPVPRVIDLVPDVDPWISDWIGWLVSKAPGDRPQRAERAWDTLEEILIRVLGPRWRREASLLNPADAATPPRPARRDQHAGVPAGAVAAGWTGRRAAAAQFEPTIPPPRQADQPAPVGTTRRPPRIPRRLKFVSLVAMLLIAAGVGGKYHGAQNLTSSEASTQKQLSTTLGDESAQPTPASAAPQSVQSDSAQPTPGSVGPQSVQNESAQPTPAAGAPLSEQVAPARQLAATYDSSAAQVEQRARNGTLSSADTALAAAMRETAAAYRAAADAAARGDVDGYTAALTSATLGRNEVSSRLDAHSDTGGAPGTTTVPAPADTSCAGDSVSDDASDDSCDP